MANDRIYMRCKSCGQKLYIGKSMGGGFYYPDWMSELERKLNDFYYDHTFCNGGDEGTFDIVYESEKEKTFEQEIIHCEPKVCIPDWCPHKDKLKGEEK